MQYKKTINQTITHNSQLEESQPQLCEDTNHIWERLCIRKFGQKGSDEIQGSGESWKEGFVRLANEKDARLRTLTKKISTF